MSVRPYRDIYRRECRQIMVGDVPVGGNAPISVQSMTNTLTSDAAATIAQIRELEEAGADIVRVSCPDEASTAAMKEICKAAEVPIVADIHFHYEDADFHEFKISVKASDVFLAVGAYQGLAEACDYPLHLGITEAGSLKSGTVKSSIGMGMLLWAGIGDTIRVSLSADPVEEIKAGFEILKSLGLRHRGVQIISCPSCARQAFEVIKTVEILEERLSHITTPMSLSVIGCVVNGPGEARETDIGLTGGGKGNHMVYLKGVTDHKITDKDLLDHIVELVEAKAAEIEAGLTETMEA